VHEKQTTSGCGKETELHVQAIRCEYFVVATVRLGCYQDFAFWWDRMWK